MNALPNQMLLLTLYGRSFIKNRVKVGGGLLNILSVAQ